MASQLLTPKHKLSNAGKEAILVSPGATVSLAGKRVVVVEDEGVTQMQLRRILTVEGLVVAGYALTGEQGIEVARRERPDIVLMDIKMPGSVTGLEAARRILDEQKTCVIFLTAFEEYQSDARVIGASGYVVKPIDSATFLPYLVQAWETFISKLPPI